jgi:hypothetical protein
MFNQIKIERPAENFVGELCSGRGTLSIPG